MSDVLLCFVGGGWDLNGEPGAVLQTILRVHVQHLIIDFSPSPARRFLSHSRQTPGTYFSLSPSLLPLPPQCRSTPPPSNSPPHAFRAIIKKNKFQYPPAARISLDWKDELSLLHTNTHQPLRLLYPVQRTPLLPSLNLEWHPDNLPVVVFISLPLVLLFTPHASTETVSLMPSTSVSALAVNNPVVQSLWILFMLFFYFQLETHTHTHTHTDAEWSDCMTNSSTVTIQLLSQQQRTNIIYRR